MTLIKIGYPQDHGFIPWSFFVYLIELNIFLSLYISFDSKAIHDKGIVYIFWLGRRRWEHMIIVLS